MTHGHLIKLNEYAVALKTHFDCPVDIEFAITSTGEVLLLQVRPITALTSASTKCTLQWSYDVAQPASVGAGKPTQTLLKLNRQFLKPLTPIAQEAVMSLDGCSGGIRSCMADYFPLVNDAYMVVLNGFVYFKMSPNELKATMPPPEPFIACMGSCMFSSVAKHIAEEVFSKKRHFADLKFWDEELRPKFDRTHMDLAATSVEDMSDADLQWHLRRTVQHLRDVYFHVSICLHGVARA